LASSLISLDQPLRVLIAEDDELLAKYLALEISALGSEVEIAADGQAALQLLQERAFDVLITDWMMPHMDGIELVRRVRTAGAAEAYLHIIMMTARGEERGIRTALEAGADDFLYKPFDRIQIELGIASARRVVQLQRRLKRRNRHLAAANERTRAAYTRIKTDLAAASAMQRRLLPEPRLHGPLRFGWAFQPSLDIGGDSIGAVDLPNGRILFFIIDIAGHGIPAALNSFALHNRLVQLAPAEPQGLVAAVALINEEMSVQPGETYFTAIFGLAEPSGERVWLLRAGHPMPLLCRHGSEPLYLEEGGLPIGMLPDLRHELSEITLHPGDRLLLYTDGVTDCADHGCMDQETLADFCLQHRDVPLQSLATSLEARLAVMRGGKPPEDDISVFVLERACEEHQDNEVEQR
jgi:sigma-B regulation protein RsbU (phosphoserine phosphatase)